MATVDSTCSSVRPMERRCSMVRFCHHRGCQRQFDGIVQDRPRLRVQVSLSVVMDDVRRVFGIAGMLTEEPSVGDGSIPATVHQRHHRGDGLFLRPGSGPKSRRWRWRSGSAPPPSGSGLMDIALYDGGNGGIRFTYPRHGKTPSHSVGRGMPRPYGSLVWGTTAILCSAVPRITSSSRATTSNLSLLPDTSVSVDRPVTRLPTPAGARCLTIDLVPYHRLALGQQWTHRREGCLLHQHHHGRRAELGRVRRQVFVRYGQFDLARQTRPNGRIQRRARMRLPGWE